MLLNLWQNKKSILVMLVAVIVAVIIFGMQIRINTLQHENKTLRADIVLLKAERQSLEMANNSWQQSYAHLGKLADECNASVQNLKRKSADLQKRTATALKNAELRAKPMRDVINAIQAREIRVTASCDDAVEDAKQDLKGIN